MAFVTLRRNDEAMRGEGGGRVGLEPNAIANPCMLGELALNSKMVSLICAMAST